MRASHLVGQVEFSPSVSPCYAREGVLVWDHGSTRHQKMEKGFASKNKAKRRKKEILGSRRLREEGREREIAISQARFLALVRLGLVGWVLFFFFQP